ncbi:hypothetical protein BDC45DRAFT_510241 [Circinella umbellata]|nr:hypothetical protein BDC45DRAFT_510241 [Circinella umbellata]
MMTKKFGSFEYCFLRSLQNIMEEFPENPLQNVKEHDLIHNIIDPVLRPFISSSQCRLRWPEVNADIRKCRTNRTQRPDAILSEVEGVKYSSCIAYGEAKGTDSDNHGRAVDLVRLGIFGKDCLDANRLNHVILFQIIGESVTFYIESLQAEATYTCTQFEKISFPRSCTDIKPFIDDISSFYTIFKAFKSIRQSMDTEYWESNHRETLDTPLYMDIIDKKKSNSRSCFVHYGR